MLPLGIGVLIQLPPCSASPCGLDADVNMHKNQRDLNNPSDSVWKDSYCQHLMCIALTLSSCLPVGNLGACNHKVLMQIKLKYEAINW